MSSTATRGSSRGWHEPGPNPGVHLPPEYRGQGIGKEFFARREEHVRKLGLKRSTFRAVPEPTDHPLRPAGYRPLNEFWRSQGYTKCPELKATFEWKEIGEEIESPKTLTFWVKPWGVICPILSAGRFCRYLSFLMNFHTIGSGQMSRRWHLRQ